MAFFTSLTGLNAATSQLGVTSNNIANAGTTGFKRSRAEFGDIFSSSPLQKASSIVGQGTLLKGIQQEFSQGNIEFSQNVFDFAISGEGFFALKPDLSSVQTVFTRNGTFSLNSNRYVVDNAGQFLLGYPVNDDGSVISTTLDSAVELRIPDISGLPKASTEITLGLNLPAAAEVIPERPIFTSGEAIYSFDPNDTDSYNNSTSITVFDSLGNPSIATIYYAKTQSATVADPRNKWQAYLYVGGKELQPALIPVRNERGEALYVNEFGETTSNPFALDPGFIPGQPHRKYVLDDQPTPQASTPATVTTPIIPRDFTFGDTGDQIRQIGVINPTTGELTSNSLPSQNLFEISVDGSAFQTISLAEAGDFNGEQLAAALSREINRVFSDERTFQLDEESSQFRIQASSLDRDDNSREILIGAVTPAGSQPDDDRIINLANLRVSPGAIFEVVIGGATFKVQNGQSYQSDTGALIPPGAALPANAVTVSDRATVAQVLAAQINSRPNFTAALTPAVAPAVSMSIAITAGAGLQTIHVRSDADQPDFNIQLPIDRTEFVFSGVADLNLSQGFRMEVGGQVLNFGAEGFTNPRALVEAINARTLSDPGATPPIVGTGVRAYLEADTLVLRSVPLAAQSLGQGYDRPFTIRSLEGAAPTANTFGIAATTFVSEPIAYTPETLVKNTQEQIDAIGLPLTVTYDTASRGLSFKPTLAGDFIRELLVRGGVDDRNAQNSVSRDNPLLGFRQASSPVAVGPDDRDGRFLGREIVPNGPLVTPTSQQRFGIDVAYLRESQRFQFSSGTTGVDSRIVIRPSTNVAAANVFGLDELSSTAGRGRPSQSAITISGQAGRNISGAFLVTEQDNRISVSVDGVTGAITIPPGTYTGETFASALQSRINRILDSDGNRVTGVSVRFDIPSERFVFTSGTTGDNSFISINGHPNWGLSNARATRGDVPTFFDLAQNTDELGRLVFIDRDGKETVDDPGLPSANWFPVYLRKGELTFDTQGRLISPKEGAQYDPFDPGNGADPIVLNVDYGRNSTQFNSPFSLLSLSQDGFPSGRLDGLEVDPTGVVRATYTNGQQIALGKVLLANFANPNGLRQIGNANFLTTASSGQAVLGQAGGEGYGTIQSGARERSNVDLTQELVDLITAQRNFQANAKAIETSSSLTQTIINIRG